MDRSAQATSRDVRAQGLSNLPPTVDLTVDSDPELRVDYEFDTPLPGEGSPKVEPQPGDYTSSAFSATAHAPTSTPMGSPTLPTGCPPDQRQTASLYETQQADDDLCPH